MAQELVPLGKFASPEQQRDAVHVAIFPATSDELLFPGEHVGLVPGTGDKVSTADDVKKCGVVDPFLSREEPIPPGTRILICLFPNTVTGMRHSWQCATVPDELLTPQDVKKRILSMIPGAGRKA